MNQGTRLTRQHLALNEPPPAAPPWQTLLVLASERSQFFSSVQGLGLTPETAGAETARLYGNIARELTLKGDHLKVVQRCGTGEDAEFVAELCSFLEDKSSPNCHKRVALHSFASAESVLTSIACDGPPLATIERLHRPILFVLSSPRSGSSLLQLCLQVHQVVPSTAAAHLWPFTLQ